MAVNVKIPTPLRKYTGGNDVLHIDAATVGELLEGMERQHPGIKSKLCDESGKLRRFINVYANQDDIRFLDNLGTALKDGDEVSIVPAVAGGRS
jgi:molybdopterin synthase sulfur carrier subunit